MTTINQTILNSILRDSREFISESGQSAKEYLMLDFEASPEGWDVVFKSENSWDEISEEERAERKQALESALS